MIRVLVLIVLAALGLGAAQAQTQTPTVSITSAPPAQTTSTSATFTWTTSMRIKSTQCSLDGAAFSACSSPKSYGSLSVGTHNFTVKVSNPKGMSSASHSWQITTTSPPPPPSGNKLRWKPPGYVGGDPNSPVSYPGFIVVNAPTTKGEIVLEDSKDYFINFGLSQWSSAPSPGISDIVIRGGRHVVIVGGEINFASTNNTDGGTGLFIADGNPAGIVHIEGMEIKSVNGITIQTQRTIQLQNTRITSRVFMDDFSKVHPDIIEVWDHGPAKIRTHKLTGYSMYAGLSVLLDPPTYWHRYDVDLHGLKPVSASDLRSTIMGAAAYQGAATDHVGENLWLETSWYNPNYRRKLDDMLIVLVPWPGGPQQYAPYELHGFDGQEYVSPLQPIGGSAPHPLGSRQGDRLTYERWPTLQEEWTAGKPSIADGADANGNFVPLGSVGVNYISPGYQ